MFLVIAFSYPAAIIFSGLNHDLNLKFFSGHGGLAWVFGWLCFPWVTFWLLKYALRLKGRERKLGLFVASLTILAYSALSLPLSNQVAEKLNAIWGLPNNGLTFWSVINFPISLPVILWLSNH
jgi:hypothetical protein